VEVLSAEQSLLGSVIKNGALIKEISLQEIQFADVRNQIIFRTMKELEKNEEGIDIVSLSIQLEQQHSGSNLSNYLADLVNSVPSTHNFKTYESYINKSHQIRKVKEYIRSIEGEITTINDHKHLEDILSKAMGMLEQEKSVSFDMIETLKTIQEDIETAKDGINGIPTGFKDLDRLLDGWKLQDLNIVAARPSVGKTAFMLALANHAAESEYYVDLFSLEMSSKLLLTRMICMIGRIDSMKIRNAVERFSEGDWDKYTMAQGILSRYKDKLYISDDFSPNIQDIRSRVRQSVRDYPDRKHLVMIDYLTLIKVSGKENRTQEVGEIARNLKIMARELNVSVVLLSQLSRKVEQRQDKRPMLSDLRESGEIEQHADTVSFLYRDDYYNAESEYKNIIEVIIAKNRNGPLGKVELAFLKEYNAFVNLVSK
jgi:replicative DNA helicase